MEEDRLSFLIGFFLGGIIIMLTLGIFSSFKEDNIKSKHPIRPRLEIIVKDEKADTTFVYVKPQ